MKKILILEDDPRQREFLREELSEAGFEVRESSSQKECIQKLKSESPDLLIMDLKIPGVRGTSLLEEIRAIAPDVPLVICSAYDAAQADPGIWAHRVADFISKPIDLDILKERVRKILG